MLGRTPPRGHITGAARNVENSTLHLSRGDTSSFVLGYRNVNKILGRDHDFVGTLRA